MLQWGYKANDDLLNATYFYILLNCMQKSGVNIDDSWILVYYIVDALKVFISQSQYLFLQVLLIS